jgi:hypothetical protein
MSVHLYSMPVVGKSFWVRVCLEGYRGCLLIAIFLVSPLESHTKNFIPQAATGGFYESRLSVLP